MRKKPLFAVSSSFIWAGIAVLLATFGILVSAEASTYFDAGTLIGSMSGSDHYFNSPGQSTSGTGFVGTFSAYTNLTSVKNFAHLEFGLQGRLHLLTGTSPAQSLTFASINPALRIEFWRLYFGGGYAPLNFASTNGLTTLHAYPDHHSYFVETGLIWRVVPEFQITLNYSLECAFDKAGDRSTLPSYGLTFRFPLHPKEAGTRSASDFDGGRYPFGFMK